MALDTAPFPRTIGQFARRLYVRFLQVPPSRFDLKTMLMIRIGLAAAVSFFLMTLTTIFQIEYRETERLNATADMAVKQLELQLLRIQTGFDTIRRYPDIDAVPSAGAVDGDCVTVTGINGETQASKCSGGSTSPAPGWFSSLMTFPFTDAPISREIKFKNTSYGTVTVTPNVREMTARAWFQLQSIVAGTAMTTFVAAFLVYISVARAVAPADRLVADLNRLSAGDFSHRLTPYRLSELNRIATVSNELAEKIEQALAQRAQLAKRLLNAQEYERQQLASELHDEYGQNLTAISALSTSIESATELATARDEAGTIQRIAQDMVQSLRGTLLRLRPAEIDRFGLKEALRHLTDFWNMCSQPKTLFIFKCTGDVDQLRGNVAVHIFRLAQEGLTNAARHAQASAVELSLDVTSNEGEASRVHLKIQDNGHGGLESRREPTRGTGLASMQERVSALGGTLTWSRRPKTGVLIDIIIPVGREG